MKPATPLPWDKQDIDVFLDRPCFVFHGSHDTYTAKAKQNSEYLLHAVHAYPRLVAVLNAALAGYCADTGVAASMLDANDLLKELGEIK